MDVLLSSKVISRILGAASSILFLFCWVVVPISEAGESRSSLKRLIEDDRIISKCSWEFAGSTYLVTLIRDKKFLDNEIINYRKLIVFKEDGARKERIFQRETADAFVGMLPLSDLQGNLLTVWTGGSGYHFVVFSIMNGKVVTVLEASSRNLLDIVDIDGDGSMEIIVTEDPGNVLSTKDVSAINKVTSSIYKWSDSSYVLFKKVPWRSRFCEH